MRIIKILFLAAGAAAAATAGTIAPGFDANTLTTCDDCYSGATDLGFSADFFGSTFTQVYISNNGYLTFNAGQSTYTPTGLTASYAGQPIIAPFYADVDTNYGGTVTYGEGTYNGNAAFAATWNSVAYYANSDKVNTFQVVLESRPDLGAGDFSIFFNYGSIQWETGTASGGTDGLGGTSAAVGYALGTGAPGTYGQLDGSLVPGSFIDGGPDSLAVGTNDGTTGQFEFDVTNGNVVAATGTPEPASFMLFGLGAACLVAIRRRS